MQIIHYCYNIISSILITIVFIYLIIIEFIYRPHVLTPQSSRQVCESGTYALHGCLAAPQIIRLLSNAKSAA